MKKKDRQLVYDKYDGKCAYCGSDLPDRWHVDHIEPIVRNWVDGTCEHPERNNIENFNPACPSCNIVKGSLPLESFRNLIQGFIPSLNRDSTQYKFAKKYGLVKERDIKVKFYFEYFRI